MKYKTWQERFEEVLAFKKKHKTLPSKNSKSRYKAQNSLGRWLTQQRKYRRIGKLSKNRIKLLESIGITWDGSKLREDNWVDNFKRLTQFRNKNPDTWPSWYTKDKTERSLAIWCHFNRTWYRVTRRGLGKYPKERKHTPYPSFFLKPLLVCCLLAVFLTILLDHLFSRIKLVAYSLAQVHLYC